MDKKNYDINGYTLTFEGGVLTNITGSKAITPEYKLRKSALKTAKPKYIEVRNLDELLNLIEGVTKNSTPPAAKSQKDASGTAKPSPVTDGKVKSPSPGLAGITPKGISKAFKFQDGFDKSYYNLVKVVNSGANAYDTRSACIDYLRNSDHTIDSDGNKNPIQPRLKKAVPVVNNTAPAPKERIRVVEVKVPIPTPEVCTRQHFPPTCTRPHYNGAPRDPWDTGRTPWWVNGTNSSGMAGGGGN